MTAEEKRRRQKEARRSRVEAARLAQEQAVRRRRFVLLGAIVAFVVLVVGGAFLVLGDDDGATATDPSATDPVDPDGSDTSLDESTTTTERQAVELPPAPEGRTLEGPTPCPAEDGSEERVSQFAEAPPTCIDPDQALEAVVALSGGGSFTVALDAEAAPVAVNNFVVLARYNYFNGLPFHRLVSEFVVQGGSSGIPDYGSGGPGYSLPDGELPDGPYAVGDVAMAKSTAISGSQFFVLVSEDAAAGLPGDYPRFGRVTEGLDLLQLLAGAGIATPESDGAPTTVVTIESVAIRPVEG